MRRLAPLPLASLGLIALAAVACKPIEVHHKIDPITLNINIRLERQLDEFFDFQDEPAPKAAPKRGPSSATPAAATPIAIAR